MAVEQELAQSRFELDGNQALNELGKLEAKASEYRATMKGLKKDTEEYKKASSDLSATNKAIDAQREKLGLTGMTYKQLTSLQRELLREMKNSATAGTESYTKLEAKLRDVNEVLTKQKANFTVTKSAFEAMKNQIGGVAVGTIVGNGVQAAMQKVIQIVPEYLSSLKKISDEETQVQKTTNLTDSQYRLLNEQFKNMDTRTPREELRGLAVEAGKLGKESVKDIADFVRQADVINVALGADLGEGAVTQIGKISDIYQEEMLNIASAINEVGANSKASESYQVDFLTRLSGVAPTAKISAAAMLSYGATLENNGQQAELASTALNGFLLDFIKNSEGFGKAVGFSKGELSKLISDKGTNEAFVQWLERLKAGSANSKELLSKLEELGINGARGSNVLLTLANSTKMVREQFEVASTAIASNDSVMKEFNKNNENAAGNIEKIAQRWSKFWSSETLNDGIKNMVGWVERLTRTNLSDTIQQEQIELNGLVVAITSANDTYGTRSALIKELQDKYPNFLGNLNAETVTNDQLKQALVAVNAEYMKKIFLQEQAEKITEFGRQEIELQRKLIEQTKELGKVGKTFRIEQGGEVRYYADDIKLTISSTKTAIAELQKERDEFLKGQNELAKRLGINTNEPTTKTKTKTVDGAGLVGGGDSDGKAEAKQKKLEEANAKAWEAEEANLRRIRDSVDQHNDELIRKLEDQKNEELLKIDQKYNNEILKVGEKQQEMLNNDALTKQQKLELDKAYQDQIDLLEQQRREARNQKESEWKEADFQKQDEIRKQIELMSMSDNDRQIQEELDKYEKLIAAAQKYGIDTTGLYKMMVDHIGAIQMSGNKKLVAEDQKTVKLRIQAQQVLQNSITDLFGVIGSLMSDDAQFQRMITVAKIAIDTGAAISATMAASAENPANATTFGAAGAFQLATGIAKIVAVAAQARAATNVSIPEYTQKGFYYGGETGDENGKFVGRTHAFEYVAPKFVRHEPAVINAIGVIEAYRVNAIRTGQTNVSGQPPQFSNSNPSMSSGTDTNALFGMILQAIHAQGDKKVVLVKTDWDRFNDDDQAITFSAQR